MEQQRMTFSARYILRVIPFEVSRLHKKNEDFLSKLFEMCSRCVFEMCFRRNRKSFFLEKVFFWFSEHFIVSLLLFLETYTSLLLWTSEVALQFRIHSGSNFLCSIENVQEKLFLLVKGVFIKKNKRKNGTAEDDFQCAVHPESDSFWSVKLAQKEWRLFVKVVWHVLEMCFRDVF